VYPVEGLHSQRRSHPEPLALDRRGHPRPGGHSPGAGPSAHRSAPTC